MEHFWFGFGVFLFACFFPLVQALFACNGARPFRPGCPVACLSCDYICKKLPALSGPLSCLPQGRAPPPGPQALPVSSPPPAVPPCPGPTRPYRLRGAGLRARQARAQSVPLPRQREAPGARRGRGGRPPRCTLGAVVGRARRPAGRAGRGLRSPGCCGARPPCAGAARAGRCCF